MSRPTQAILEDALQLPVADRGEVAARLLQSLDPVADSDAAEAWANEIAIRLDDVRSGRVAPVPWAEARGQILADTDDDAG